MERRGAAAVCSDLGAATVAVNHCVSYNNQICLLNNLHIGRRSPILGEHWYNQHYKQGHPEHRVLSSQVE